MLILIDGYNLLRQVFPYKNKCLKRQRENLILQLSFYNKKGFGIKNEIIIVFDGGEFGRASREVRGGVVVIFSGKDSSADDWIYGYTCKNKEKEILLVTLDRELKYKCSRRNVESMDVLEFYDIIKDALIDDVEQVLCKRDDSFVEKVNEIENEALDIMMQQTDLSRLAEKDKFNEDIDGPHLHERKQRSGNPKRASKKERKKSVVLKKLLP